MADSSVPVIDTAATNKLEESPIPSATAPPTVNETLESSIPESKPEKPATTLDTPPPSVKPVTAPATTTTASTASSKPFSYTSPNIKFEDDPSTYLKTKVESLIYWEYPKKSATVLVGLLATLVLTQYYSLLQIVAGVFTLATGLNWVFVNTHKQGQRFIGGKSPENIANPHSERLHKQGTYIPRDRVLRTAQLTIDVVEVITQHITKLVLIEDNWRSAVSLVVSYLVWTIAKFVSTKYIVGFFIVSAFAFPRLYLQHQDVIDAHVAQQSKNARVLAEKYGGIANVKARELTEQAKSFLSKKTTASIPQEAKKTE
ncbi:Reticulon-domain-containing protein [Gilbertella persicaria]|uniref:Reticulon-domain-containing protein n=1 Tax=Gilbertella persicaria TaxID=101096 RepID=UPI00221EB1D4|nr:Reticulon-domain-containing protein [Gilbertella persicaria]KAI8085971.1 Reticulon-domain-containing protein [Gilbertella persicaria]